MNGFSKSESTADNDNWTAKWGGKFTFKATGSAGIPLVAEGKVEAGFEVSHETSWGKSRTETITDTSTSSDTEIKTTTNTTTITVPSQPVKIPPHSKISISVITWQNNIKIILNISQKVEGMVSANFIDKNNNENIVNISIKDAMISLLENEILPSKIKINNDNSISFSYDTEIKREIIMHQTEIGEAIPLSLDEQNISFKDNTTSIIVEKNKV